jgi:predicted nucleic acid-binding protein
MTKAEEKYFRLLLSECSVLELIQPIKERAIALKQAHQIKLPDAVIAATAQFLKVELLTFGKSFAKISDLDLILLDF